MKKKMWILILSNGFILLGKMRLQFEFDSSLVIQFSQDNDTGKYCIS